jgi:methyltransferase-like protein
MLASVREMMLYRTRDLADPQERATKAREFLDFLAGSIPAESGPYGSFLNTYASLLRGEIKGEHPAGDSFLLHDELEDVNEPLYFHEFAERTAAHGLQYLGEAELRTMADTNFSPEVSAGLREMSGSIVELEQYMDFVRNQTLRKTLLCHEGVTLSRVLTADRLSSLCVASYAEPVTPDADINAVAVAQFRSADGAVLSTDHPLTKAAMLHLAEIWPRVIPIGDLFSAACSRLGIEQITRGDERLELEAQVLNTNLLKGHMYSGYLVELHAFAPQLVLEAGECPVASPVARLQAQSGPKVTNLRHERVELDELNRYLLVRLDGCHSRAALVDALEEGPVAEGLLVIHDDGQPVADAARMRELLAESVQKRIAWLARAGLLPA